jgi:hypothetical protein
LIDAGELPVVAGKHGWTAPNTVFAKNPFGVPR